MTSSVKVGEPDWQKKHLAAYLKTGGQDGHFLDFSAMGGDAKTPTMLLKTIGRKSGEPRLMPLIYGWHGKDVVIIASRGGHDEHPAWYLNMEAASEVEFQVLDKVYRGPWRLAKGEERAAIWEMMAKINPLYRGYEGVTAREIPVVLLEPKEEIAKL